MKRIISLILVICLLGTSIPWAYAVEPAAPQPVEAQTDTPEVATPEEPEEELPPILYAVTSSGETADGFVYQVIDDASVTIIGYTGTAAALTVPGTIQGLPVTAIGMEAFYNCKTLTSVVLPEGLTTLGHHAFGRCDNLSSVTIPESFTTVQHYRYFDNTSGPFYNCTNLRTVTFSGLPDGTVKLFLMDAKWKPLCEAIIVS